MRRQDDGNGQAQNAENHHVAYEGGRNGAVCSLLEPAEGFDELSGLEDGRSDGGKRPAVTEQSPEERARHAHVGPVLQEKIVSLENQPERNGEQGHLEEIARGVAEAGASGDGEDGGVANEEIGGPGDGSEVGGDGFDMAEHEPFGAGEGGEAEPSGVREGMLFVAQKFEEDDGNSGGGDDDPKLNHAAQKCNAKKRSLSAGRKIQTGPPNSGSLLFCCGCLCRSLTS